jgi:Co/Zn/Cd efflux system component
MLNVPTASTHPVVLPTTTTTIAARTTMTTNLGVIASAAVVALGIQIADPLIGLIITLVILRITWDSWNTVRSAEIEIDHFEDHQ